MNRQDAKSAKEEPSVDLDGLARQAIGAMIEVHRVLGPGYLEAVYEEALAIELGLHNILLTAKGGFSRIQKPSGWRGAHGLSYCWTVGG